MKIVISGAAGFIGSHLAARFLSRGDTVIGIDNLSRQGSGENLRWLESLTGDFRFFEGDIRSEQDLARIFAAQMDADAIIHEAAQVAVTTSVTDPRSDFEINAWGTFNMLEAARRFVPRAIFLFASTNKVYGGLDRIEVAERDGRYAFRDNPAGIGESEVLDFHSPYGCSKGCADQYVRDYSRIYGLRSVVLRQSCIYGTRQYGVEDQGWVAWFTIAAILGRPITIYGDGKQVRDVLWIDDLVDLYARAIEHIDTAAGQIYNVGGGAGNTLSVLEVIDILEKVLGRPVEYSFSAARPGDQRVFIADCAKARRELSWSPQVNPTEGVRRIAEWVLASRDMLERTLGTPAAAHSL